MNSVPIAIIDEPTTRDVPRALVNAFVRASLATDLIRTDPSRSGTAQAVKLLIEAAQELQLHYRNLLEEENS